MSVALTPGRRQEFLELLRRGFTPSRTADMVGVARLDVYEARTADDAFAGQWAEAYASGTDALSRELRTRAIEGERA